MLAPNIKAVYITCPPSPENNERFAQFIRNYGESRIRDESFQRIVRGDYIGAITVTVLFELVALTVWGWGLSITIVHPHFRNKGIARYLIAQKPTQQTRIGANNIASIKATLAAGFTLTGAETYKDRVVLIFERRTA